MSTCPLCDASVPHIICPRIGGPTVPTEDAQRMDEPACPRCGAKKCVGHVENDRIAWWSCDACEYQWPRGMWTYDSGLVCKHCGERIVPYGSSLSPKRYRHVFSREGERDVFLAWCPVGTTKAEL